MGRRAVSLENEHLRITVLEEGGHLAEVREKQAGVNPLWIPAWDSIEPSKYEATRHLQFGESSEAKLLAGIMGHNLCLDLFGGPSAAEAALGVTAHGESSVARYDLIETPKGLEASVRLPLAQIAFTRRLELVERAVKIEETVENLAGFDRPIAWTQHVTLGPPFLDPKTTEFRASMGRSMVMETDLGTAAYLQAGAEFLWPNGPLDSGGTADLRRMHAEAPASSYTAHLADENQEDAFWVAFSAQYGLAFGYVWKRADFPWLGIWEENGSRPASPWNGRALTRGMEFGVSPFPETRQAMVARGRLFGEETFRWLPGRGRLTAKYWVVTERVETVPERLAWPAG